MSKSEVIIPVITHKHTDKTIAYGSAWIQPLACTGFQAQNTKGSDIWNMAQHYLWITFGPVVYITGTIGNILIIIVIRSGTMRTSTTCVYVTFIAIFDLITLLSGMTNEVLKVGGVLTRMLNCKIHLLCPETHMSSPASDCWYQDKKPFGTFGQNLAWPIQEVNNSFRSRELELMWMPPYIYIYSKTITETETNLSQDFSGRNKGNKNKLRKKNSQRKEQTFCYLSPLETGVLTLNKVVQDKNVPKNSSGKSPQIWIQPFCA